MRTASRTATRTAAQIAARTARSPHDVVSSRAVSNQVLQASLKVGPVDDPLEREADAVADALVQGEAAGPVRSGPASVVRRQPMPLPGAAPGSPPPPVMEPLRPLVTTWEVDTKTDAQKLGKGAGEAAGAALDTGPGKALQDAATAQLERDWQKASPGDRALMVIAAVQALAGVAALKAIPEADEGPPAPDKTPRIKISRDFKVQLEFKLGWKDKGPDGTETQRRTPRIDAVTVSLFYTPEGPKGPPDAELVAAEIARLQAALAPFRPKPTGDGFAVDYAVRRMLEERTRRPSWLRSEEGAARAREADRFKLDAGPFAARPQPGVRLVPELELGPMPPPGKVQRKCAACAAEEHTDETIRLKSAGPAAGPPAAAGADAAVAGLDRGTPLPAAERRFFEARLGRDFSAVRLHSDNTGAVTIGARAFTLGRQVAFAPGEWRPGTVEGRRLLAHELVHVVQQDAAAERAVRRQPADAIGQSDKDDEEAPEVAGPTAAGSTTGQPAPSAGGSASTTAPLAPAVTVTPGGHAAAPPGVAPCPDPPTRNLVVVGCTAKAAAAPPAVEKAELPTLNPARFGGDADRARFAKELAQCHAARTVKDEIDRRYRAAVEAARKQATDQAKQDTDAAIKAATENIPPGDRAALARAKAQAVADAKKAATKKISDAQAAVTRQDVAAVTAELSTRLENELATDYDETLKGALGRYGPGWLATMQAKHGAAGLTVGRDIEKMGVRASLTSEVSFDNTPATCLLGEKDAGAAYLKTVLADIRVMTAALALGVGSAALDEAVAYAADRKQFGRPIKDHQAVQAHLAEMAVDLEAARRLTYWAAWRSDQGLANENEAAMAKLFASEAALRICDRAARVLGSYGFASDYPVERYLRDVRFTLIGGGTSEILRGAIARGLYP